MQVALMHALASTDVCILCTEIEGEEGRTEERSMYVAESPTTLQSQGSQLLLETQFCSSGHLAAWLLHLLAKSALSRTRLSIRALPPSWATCS